MRGYPQWFYRLSITAFLLLVVSGFLLIPNALEFRLEWDIGWSFPNEIRLLIVALHATFAFLIVGKIGALWSVHMRIGWRHNKNVKSGLSLVTIFTMLIFSGIGIYYFGDRWSVTSSFTHILLGLTLPIICICHIIIGRNSGRIHKVH